MNYLPLKSNRGYLVIQALVFGTIGLILIGGLVGFAQINIRAARLFVLREKAFQISEAGLEYYRWHLAHAATDFQDGTGAPGPYVHPYKNKDGQIIGSYTLTITPPPIGSTVVTIVSEGKVIEDANVSRKIEVKLAIPSLAKYAFVANSAMRFGVGTEVFGPIHSNDGIRFDGLAHNIVTSGKADYDDPDHGPDPNEFGVHTHVNAPPATGMNNNFRPNEAPPTTPVPSRSDLFLIGRQFPVPAVDFAGLTNDLADIRDETLAPGDICTPDVATGKLCFPGSGQLGYNIVLKTNDTLDLFKVTSLISSPSSSCTNSKNQTAPPSPQPGWGTWSVGSQTRVNGPNADLSFSFPTNGLIFLEDNIWVEGQIQTARLTIIAARFPDPADTNITVNKNLLYTTRDGQDVIALIAQNNFNVGMVSNNILTIDAALVAKNGRAGRYYYNSSCGSANSIRSTLSLYGMIATSLRYGFAYSNGTGYITRNITYDGNLLYGPPPSFPLTSDQYSTISWREL